MTVPLAAIRQVMDAHGDHWTLDHDPTIAEVRKISDIIRSGGSVSDEEMAAAFLAEADALDELADRFSQDAAMKQVQERETSA